MIAYKSVFRKYIISSEATFDFLKDLVADVPDGHVTEQNGETPSAGASNSSQSRHRARLDPI